MSAVASDSLIRTLLPEGLQLPTSGLRGVVAHYVKWQRVDINRLSRELDGDYCVEDFSSPGLMQAWQDLMTLALLADLQSERDFSSQLQARADCLLQYPFWDSFQPGAALAVLCQQLMGRDVPLPLPQQLARGAALIDHRGRWPWAAVPHQRQQAQLATWWAVGAVAMQDETWSHAASGLVRWLRRCVSTDGIPLRGLFVRQDDFTGIGLHVDHLIACYAAALASSDGEHLHLAHQLENVLRHYEPADVEAALTSAAMMAVMWLDARCPRPEMEVPNHEMALCDPSCALLTIHRNKLSAAATVAGGGTGLGTVRYGEVAICSYGPELLPLGDGEGFGLADGRWQPEGCLVRYDDGIGTVQGRCVVEGHPTAQSKTAARWRCTQPSGVWLEVEQRWQGNTLLLSAIPVSLQPTEGLAIAYYVSADSCAVGGGQVVRPQSLDRYAGPPQEVICRRGDDVVYINLDEGAHAMHVIPLAGGESFWGADFLVAHQLAPVCERYLADIAVQR